MKSQTYKSVTTLSFGEVMTEIKPDSGFKDQQQALDAMLVTAHSSLTGWVIDYTLDPDTKGGKQEQISASISDGGRQIAQIMLSVPTTSNFQKTMFERLLEQTIVPEVQKAVRSYPSTRESVQARQASGQHPLTEEIIPDALRRTGQVSPRQLQAR